MNQPVLPQDLPPPDGLFPSPFPLPHPHPHPHPAASGSATSTPTPTPSPPPPSGSAPTLFSGADSSAAGSSSSSSSSPLLAQHHQSLLRAAVRSGDLSGLLRLLEAWEGEVNLNVLDGDGQTPLHHSCHQGDLPLVQLLVRFGADVRLANRDGWTAMHIAAFGGHKDVLLYLMTAGPLACRKA